MENSSTMGMNRTGAQMSPFKVSDMQDVSETFELDSVGDEMSIAALREDYIANADSIGSVPIPGTATGVLKTGMEKLKGNNPEVLIDKLGERLAFERTGTRLYDALIAKCEASNGLQIVPPLEQLYQFRLEEAQHFRIVVEAIESLGADPTAQTPCADAIGVASIGLMQVLTDPRTDIPQCLNVMLTAELTDNAGWELLILLARKFGKDEMAQNFERALAEEEVHLQSVRQWLSQNIMAESE